MVHLERMAMRVVEAIYKFKYFIFCRQKNTGKMARAQGKHREFGINWSVATLNILLMLYPLYLKEVILLGAVYLTNISLDSAVKFNNSVLQG